MPEYDVTSASGARITGKVTIPPGAGAGDVVGPASATDNAVARYDGTTGKLIQNSVVTIDDNGGLFSSFLGVGPDAGFAGVGQQVVFENDFVTPPTNFQGVYGFWAVSPQSDNRNVYAASLNAAIFGSRPVASLQGVISNVAVDNDGDVNQVFASYARSNIESGTANVSSVYDNYLLFSKSSTGTVAAHYGQYVATPNGTTATTTVTDNFAHWIGDQSGVGTHSSYAFWYDSPGVYRIKGDGVMGYYNPSFTKYTPGAVNHERVVQQWNSNVLEYGPEAGGTGVLRGMRLLGASLEVASLIAANQISPTGKFNVMADADGKLYVSNVAN
jgi:hypothetical protein